MAKGKKTGGRVRGTGNAISGVLKDMILTALSDVGGTAYLAGQARQNPQAFMSLLGRVLPMQMTHSGAIAMPAVHYARGADEPEIDLRALLTPRTVQ